MNKKIAKQSSKLTFNGIHKSLDNCDSYTFRQNEIFKPIYVGFAILELSKLHMYQTYYDKLHPYFGEKYLHFHYMDSDSFVVSLITHDVIKVLQNLEDLVDSSNLNKDHEVFSDRKSIW